MLNHPNRLVDWLPVIHGEFEERSDLRLTVEQASERWGVDATRLEAIMDTFVDVGYLGRSPDGVYSRRPDRLAA
jgi:hypothetical protein